MIIDVTLLLDALKSLMPLPVFGVATEPFEKPTGLLSFL